MMKLEQVLDIDGTMIGKLTCDEDFGSFSKFRRTFLDVFGDSLGVQIEKMGNLSLAFKTSELRAKQPSRTYVICWSDVCRLNREHSICVFSYEANFKNKLK